MAGKRDRITTHSILWCLMILTLVFVLGLGAYVVLHATDAFALLFAIGGFSIAFAMSYFSVSGALCGIRVAQEKEEKHAEVRKIESHVVRCAMLVLWGGLIIIGSAGMLLIGLSWRVSVHVLLYFIGASLFLFGVCSYVFLDRGWPWKVRGIVNSENAKPTSAATSPSRKSTTGLEHDESDVAKQPGSSESSLGSDIDAKAKG